MGKYQHAIRVSINTETPDYFDHVYYRHTARNDVSILGTLWTYLNCHTSKNVTF